MSDIPEEIRLAREQSEAAQRATAREAFNRAQAERAADKLHAALMATRAQWIHSVNAPECLEALSEWKGSECAQSNESDTGDCSRLSVFTETTQFVPLYVPQEVLQEYHQALAKFSTPLVPLQVYDSNSTVRVGLKGRYMEVVWAAPLSDGVSTIAGRQALEAMVAAFNAMLAAEQTFAR